MAKIHETTMTLRFFGDDLDPNEITSRLGCQPTVGAKIGEVWTTVRGTEKIARTGTWRLNANKRQPGDLNAHVAELLAPLNDDLSVWRDLTARFKADVFCGIWMTQSNEGTSLSAESMMNLGARGLPLEFDIYDPSPE
jgi:hypothetical protein